MSLFRRLFSADYRAALAAEAAGDLELAAERYALAGQTAAAVRVHLERASRTDDRVATIKALRDALHWAEHGTKLHADVARALGRALLARALDEGVATAQDRQRVRSAAELLVKGGAYEEAGDALEQIGDDRSAASAFERGGLLVRMESALARQTHHYDQARIVDSAFAEYEMYLNGGERDAARDKLRTCIEFAERKAEYRRLLDQLESRLITGGHVLLRNRTRTDSADAGQRIILCAGPRITLGRDNLSEVMLRSGGVSRAHAEVLIVAQGAQRAYQLRDLGSRNGTLIGGLPIAGAVPLQGTGSFALGEDCEIQFSTAGTPALLTLRIERGMDRGLLIRAGAEGDPLPVAEVSELPATVQFTRGRPLLTATSANAPVRLNGASIARGEIQLLHGDSLLLDGQEIDIE